MKRYLLFRLLNVPDKPPPWAMVVILVTFAIVVFASTADRADLGIMRRILLALAPGALIAMVVPILILGEGVQFYLCTRRFRTLDAEHVRLHYAPDLQERIDWQAQLRIWEEALADLQGWFGRPLKRKVVVFLFARHDVINRLFKFSFGGCALVRADAVIIAADFMQEMVNPKELVRHELVHLFAAYCGKEKPCFKDEGLTTWLQGTMDDKPVDFHALAIILGQGCPPALNLLNDRLFMRERSDSYVLAGSFTGYLLRRFDKTTYFRYLRLARSKRFTATFLEVFGISVVSAEVEWREQLLARRQEFEPEISAKIAELKAAIAFRCWNYQESIDLALPSIESGQADDKIAAMVAHAYFALGRYDEAASRLQKVLDVGTAYPSYQSRLWFNLGTIHDLSGRRDEALKAYNRALAFADDWTVADGSTHRLARRHLKTPFTEESLREQLERHARAS